MRSGTWVQRAAWIAVFVPFVILALLRMPEGPRADADDYAQYLLHAQALADGRPYTDIGFIPSRLAPFGGPSARPPGLPLILAPVVAAGGTRSPMIPLLSIGLSLAFLVFAVRTFRDREPRELTMVVGLLSGIQPEMLHFAPQPLSDLPFAALVWAVIMLCDTEDSWSARTLILLSLAGAAAISVRLAGVALIPALAAYGLLHARRLGFRSLVPLLAWSATFWLITNFLPTTDAPGADVGSAWRSVFSMVPGIFRSYSTGVREALLYPFDSNVPDTVYHLIMAVLLCIGAASSIRAYWRSFVFLFTGVYVPMLFVIPVRDGRYLYPLIPVVILLVARGALVSLRWMRPSMPDDRRVRMVAIGAFAIAVLATWTAWQPVRPSGLASRPDSRALFAAMRPLAATGARVNSFKAHVITLETGVPAMSLLRGPPAAIIGELCAKRITHVIVGDFGIFPNETEQLRQTIATYPDRFREEYRNDSFSLWRFDERPSPTCG